MASIVKVGRFYHVMYWRDGKQRKFSTRSGNRAIAEQVKRKVEDELAADKYGLESLAPIEISLGEFLVESLKFIEGSRAKNTVILYHQVARDFDHFVGANKMISSITTKTVIEWCSRSAKDGRKPSTINKYLSVMQALFAMAEKLHYISTNPFKDAPRYSESERTPRFLSADEAERLLAYFRGKKMETNVMLALFAGLRLSETMELKWRDVDFANHNLHITGKGDKGRTVPIPGRLLEHLVKTHANSHTISVCKAYASRSGLSTIFVRMAQSAGIQGVSFHTLRHTFATWLVQRGAPLPVVQQLLGHTTITTTMIYAHIDVADKRRAVAMLD